MARVLHIEDDSDWRDGIASIMQRKGHEIVSCSTLAEGEQMADQSPFDLIICDGTLGEYRLNKGNGLRLAKRLHAAGKKVVLLSGDNEKSIPSIWKGSFEESDILQFLN